MESRLLVPLFAAMLAAALASPIVKTENKPPSVDLISALDAYVTWTESVTSQFDGDDVTSLDVQELEEEGEALHDALMSAIDLKVAELDMEVDKDMEKNVLASLEEEMISTNVDNDKILGLIVGDSQISNHGARLAVASRLFSRLSERLRGSLEESREELDEEKLNKIIEEVTALEIVLEAVVSNFHSVENLVIDEEGDSGIKDENDESDSESESEEHVSRQKRQTNGFNLGGGFSTNGRSVTYSRGRTSVTATPHYSLRPKPQFHGATIGATPRFSADQGRITGSVYGSATVNNRGRPTGGQIGVRINF